MCLLQSSLTLYQLSLSFAIETNTFYEKSLFLNLHREVLNKLDTKDRSGLHASLYSHVFEAAEARGLQTPGLQCRSVSKLKAKIWLETDYVLTPKLPRGKRERGKTVRLTAVPSLVTGSLVFVIMIRNIIKKRNSNSQRAWFNFAQVKCKFNVKFTVMFI